MQTGSLQLVKDRHGVKVWRAQWREDGKGRTRILGKYAEINRAEARALLDKILEPIGGRREAAVSGAVTLRRYIEDDYLIVKNRVWKGSTRSTTEQIIQTHITNEIGYRPIVDVTRRELQALLDAKAAAGLSSSVIGHVRWQLVAILEMAKSDRLIPSNPAEGLVMPKCAGEVDKRVIDVSAIQRAQMVLEIRERLVFRLAVCEGMRPGEIVGLQLGDLQDDGIHIQRRIYRRQQDDPKSRLSRRVIPPTSGTRAVLREYVELLSDRRPEAWLFPSEAGNTPIDYGNVFRRRIQKALVTVGLGDVNFQVLRRTWVTECAEVEPDAKVRASLAGHSVDVDENEYRQASAQAMKRAMRKLERRLQ